MIYTIGPEHDGVTVREYLRSVLGMSRTAMTRLKKRERGILLRGQRVTVRAVMRAGDTLELDEADSADEVNEYIEPVDLPFRVLYEDEDIIAVDKPAGMPTHPSRGHRRDTLANAAAFYFAECGKPFVFRAVNRLDTDTSGVVLLAKNKHAAFTLSRGISPSYARGVKIQKEYFAVLRGIINPAEPLRGVSYLSDDLIPEDIRSRLAGIGYAGGRSGLRRSYGIIDAPIRRALPSIMLREVSFTPDAYDAITGFLVEDEFESGYGQMTAVRAFPRTGRTHQLRVHFAYLGCPIVGDTLYGRYAGDEGQPIARQALHCAAMTVGDLRIESPLPEDIQRLLNTGKNNE
jgi:23S rRNA pseudouridine1911/1915/1917 synthase